MKQLYPFSKNNNKAIFQNKRDITDFENFSYFQLQKNKTIKQSNNQTIKTVFSILCSLLFPLFLQAQVTLAPEKPSVTETVTLTFDASQGNGGLADYDGDIYAHTGLITGKSAHPKDWKNIVVDWNDNQEKLKLKKTGDNTYQLKFTISTLYGVAEDADVKALIYVFRNADGSQVGKTEGEQDIYYFLKDMNFKDLPKPHVNDRCEAAAPDWAKYATVYEVNVRQYTREGTFNAFAKRLPELRKLGVDILWFMPIHPIGVEERKGTLGSYYSIKDYTAVNPEFGTMDDFKNLVNQAHGMGFKVILDWVANHTSRDHAWVTDHPDWYNYGDDGKIIAPYDWTDVADLNYDQYYMRAAMMEAMEFWVKEVDIDGYRCDVAGEVPLDFWEDVRVKLDEIKAVWMLAEDADKTYLMNEAFNANYGWPFHHTMNSIAKGKEEAHAVFDYFGKIADEYPQGSYPLQFITNHDENSWNGTIQERLGEGHKAFAVLSFTVPGIPLIYSGQEAGMKKRLEFFEKDPIDWSNKSLIPFYTQLNDLKAENPALWNGDAGGWIQEIENDKPESVVAFSREQGNNKVVTVINLSSKAQTVTLQNGKNAGIYTEHFSGKEVTLAKRPILKLGAWEYKVFLFKKKAHDPKRTFQAIEKTKTGLKILTSDGTISLKPYSENTLEVEFVPVGESNPPSAAVATTAVQDANAFLGKMVPNLSEKGNSIVYSTNGISVTIQKNPFKMSYSYKNAPLFAEEKGYFENDTMSGFRFHLDSKEQLMGGGERVLGMNRRGKRLKLYNQASYGYETEAELMYYSMPVAISSKKYMLVFDNGASGFMDLGATESNILQFEAVGGRMSYLVVAANEWQDLAVNYTSLTGRQPMLPRWALGNIASRMGYHSQAEVEGVVDQYLADDIPLDAIVLDLYWFGRDLKGHLGNLEWDLDSFPQPEKMMKNIHEKGVKTVLITEPFIIKGTGKYAEAVEQDLLGTTATGEPYLYDFYFGTTTLLDIFKPATKRWFWDIYKRHTRSGVAGWWGDLGEPEVHPSDLQHVNGSADEVHNLYGHEWAKMIYEGFASDFPNRRPVTLMRSGFVGSQRYGMVPWSGDVNRSWKGLQPQVEIALTMGMQGLAYMHSDLGGFAGAYEDAELYTRWLQYGVFQPIYRTHAQESVPAEPIYWDEATKDIVRQFIKLRYELMPYNYTLTYENATKGIPMMRPLFYVDDNPALLANTTSYLWGDNFLVTPITKKGATSQKVYLPKNATWINYWTGEAHRGGQEIEVETDINTIPVFVKAGAFIPTVPAFQSMNDYSSEKLTVHYYHHPSVTESSGLMYEDDGETKEAYFKDEFELLQFEATFKNGALSFTFSPEGGDYVGKPDGREVTLVVHNLDKKPESVLVDGSEVVGEWGDGVVRVDFELGSNSAKLKLK